MPLSSFLVAPWGTRMRAWLFGTEGHVQFVIPTSNRKLSAQVMVSSFRIAGLASANHNCFYVANLAASTVLMGVRRLTVQMDNTGAVTTVSPTFMVYKTTTLPTGGTDSTKFLFDSNDTSNTNCVARGATASEGGAANAITWTAPAGTPGWRQFHMRMHTLVGQVLTRDESLIPIVCQDDPIVLRAGQALAIQVNIASQTTASYVFNAMWEEFVVP
jgi:hypothetical protein